MYKKTEIDYKNVTNQPNPNPDIVTRLFLRKQKAHKKSRDAANDSTRANRQAKTNFYNTVNNTLRNPSISAKKEIFNIINVL